MVATHRTLPMGHPVFKLLQPHWYKTLPLNAAARATLVPQIIKELVGVKPAYVFRYIRGEFENLDFVSCYVPSDLAAHSFPNTVEGLADLRFRDYTYARNMVPMWYCIRDYVKTVLAVHYVSDAVAAASKAFYDELRRLDVEFAKNSNAMNKNSIPYNVMSPDSTAVSILI